MFFELENCITEIVDVNHITWNKQQCSVLPREYSAIAFRIKGSGNIEYDKGNIFADTSSVLYLPQNIAYRADYSSTELIVIHFKTQAPDDTVEVFSFESTDKIYKLFLEALNLWRNKEIGYKILTLSTLYKLLGVIYRESQIHAFPKNFMDAISVINSDYKDNFLSIKQVCQNAKISETYFRKLFLQHYNKTPIKYINELRIEHARNLIASGTSIEEAAYSSGFNDPKYFARVVKKYFKCTPRDLKSYGK